MDDTTSRADSAAEAFDRLIAENKLFNHADQDLSEADTRCKLIDPLFKEVLDWQEADIRREPPAADGFADYVFGADFPYFHVEAKRTLPRFSLNVTSRARVLKLKGPHLLGNKEVKPILEQTAKYSFDLGTEFAILTNGSQLILFKTHLHGRSWKDGSAYVWHNHDDIKNNFAFFYSLLSKQAVCAGSLLEKFQTIHNVTVQSYTPSHFLSFPDREFVRNSLWGQISAAFGPLLMVQPDDPEIQKEIVTNCYVSTPLSDQVDRSINELLRDRMPKFLRDSNVSDLSGALDDSKFRTRVLEDMKSAKPKTYILTGGVGSGKTTFLRRFAFVLQPDYIRNYGVWIHIDYLPIGNLEDDQIDSQLKSYTYQKIREVLENGYGALLPSNGEQVRALFKSQIDEFELTKLYKTDKDSPEWQKSVNDLVHSLYSDLQTSTDAILRHVLKQGRSIVFVLDNTDQLGEHFQAAVFLLAQYLSDQFRALSVVALREEKYFAAYRRGIFDAYGDRRFHIGSPNLSQVIEKRLGYGLKKMFETLLDRLSTSDLENASLLIGAFIRSATRGNANIVRMLSCVSNGDMRYALDLFKEFLSSGNTDIGKILDITRKAHSYTIPFHEFAKSAILGSRRFYKSSISHAVNLFARSSSRQSSHFAACRIIVRLCSAQGSPSPHGDGFVDTVQLLREYRESFGFAEDFVLRGEELLRRGLIESEPPRAKGIHSTVALRITASGAYYWNYLVRSFAYLDLVFVDTPLQDQALARDLADLAESTDLTVRFDRVRKFLNYLWELEGDELSQSSARGGPYQDSLVKEIQIQVEREILVIRKKTGALDRYLASPRWAAK